MHSIGFESGFESRAFGGELEFEELGDYFGECDLYPSQADVDHAIDLVFREPAFAFEVEDKNKRVENDNEKGQDVQKKRGLQRHQVLELTFQLYPPRGTGITNSRTSTWMNPIVDGEEAIKLLGTEGVEPTDFKTVWNFVAASRREQQETRDQSEKNRRDEDHLRIMAEKRRKDEELRDELRKMGAAGYSGKAYRKKVNVLEKGDEIAEKEGPESLSKKDKKVQFADDTATDSTVDSEAAITETDIKKSSKSDKTEDKAGSKQITESSNLSEDEVNSNPEVDKVET